MDFCSFSPKGGNKDEQENQQIKGILRKNPENGLPNLAISKPNFVKPKTIQELAEVVGNIATNQPIKKKTPTKANTSNNPQDKDDDKENKDPKENKSNEKKTDGENKVKERKTVVAFGRTTLADQTIPAAIKNVPTKKPAAFGLAKDVFDLKKEVDEQSVIISQLENDVEYLKEQNSRILDEYTSLLELIQKQSDKITKLEIMKNSQIDEKKNNSFETNKRRDFPLDSIALTNKKQRGLLNETIAEEDPTNHARHERRDMGKSLQPYSSKSVNSDVEKMNDLLKKNPDFAKHLNKLVKDFTQYGHNRSDHDDDNKPLSRIIERHERRREYRDAKRYEDDNRRNVVRESYTVRREVCYSPRSDMLSTTIDDTLKDDQNYTRRYRRHHRNYHEPSTPRVEEVSDENFSDNDDKPLSKIYDNHRYHETEYEHNSVVRKNVGNEKERVRLGNIQYTVMKDKFDDDFDNEPGDNDRSTSPKSHIHHRVSDRFARNRKM